MSAPASNPVKNNSPDGQRCPSMEMVRLAPQWTEALRQFFQDLQENGDEIFFSPHPADEDSLSQIAGCKGRDLYYVLVEEEKILGYGLLRGWDEGFQIPSLGVAIHPSARGAGMGKMFMSFLHALARRRGASKVRLRVHMKNEAAIRLYKRFGYVFEEDRTQAEYLVGFMNLGKEWPHDN